MASLFQKQSPFRLALIVAGLFWLLCSSLVLWRYHTFFPTYVSFDQGIFNQVFWNTLRGRLFESSLSSTEAFSVMQGAPPEVFYRRLGQHFTPALLLWVPFYSLLQSPAGLSLLQVSLVTAAGLVLYALARCYHPPRLALWFTASYYGAIAVIGPTLANFHDICQIPLYAFGLLLAIERRRWVWMVLCAVLLLAVREDSGVVLFSIGFYWVVSRRWVGLGLGFCAVSLGYMLALTNWVMPLFSDDVAQRFMVEQFGQFTNGQGASTLEVIRGILSNPWLLLVELVTPGDRTLSYVLGQLLPLAFLPLISVEAWLLTGFTILKTLIQKDPTALSLHLRYAMTWVPGLFYGTILWWAKHPNAFQRRSRSLWAASIALSLLFTVTANPNRALSFVIPDSIQPWVYVSPARQWQHAQAIRRLMAQIPAQASVTATDHIVAHLSNRREIVRFPGVRLVNDQRQEVMVDYAIADLWYFQQYQVAFDDYRQSLTQAREDVTRLINRRNASKRYGMISFTDGVVLLQRNRASEPTALDAWQTYPWP